MSMCVNLLRIYVATLEIAMFVDYEEDAKILPTQKNFAHLRQSQNARGSKDGSSCRS